MSAYIILMAIASAIGIASIVCVNCVRKQWVKSTATAILACCILTFFFCFLARFSMSLNEDVVVEMLAWRKMVENCEIEVYDDCGHLTTDAINYNIKIDEIHYSLNKYGRWSQWYVIGAEELEPITKK